MPPNLKIDPRSTCSPFYNVNQEHESKEKEKEPSAEAYDEENEASKKTKAEPDAEKEITEIEKAHDAIEYVIPLPDRLHVNVFDLKDSSKNVGTLWLDSTVFGQDPIRVDLIHRAVLHYRNKQRGRRKAITKTISEVSGSGRKVRPQKGQGTARAGHSRPAHWRGGAKAHGPKGNIQNYGNCKLNKKVKRLALLHMLSQKLREGNVILVNDLVQSLDDSHKTKRLAQVLGDQWNIGHQSGLGATALIVDYIDDESTTTTISNLPVSTVVASRNIYKIKLVNPKAVHVYDLLKYEKLLLTVSAMTAIEERLMKRR